MDDSEPKHSPETDSNIVQADSLSPEEKERLRKALEDARDNVKATVKRLKESEAVSHDLLSARLKKSGPDGARER